MTRRRIALAGAIALIAGIVTSGTSAGPADAADAGTVLPGGTVNQALTDNVHGHLLLRQDGDVLVTGLTGGVLATLPEPGSGSMTLSSDDSTLYVARADGTIAAVDTATSAQTTLYATAAGIAPTGVALDGGRVWFTYDSTDGSPGGIGSLDPARDTTATAPADGTPAPSVTLTPAAGAADPQTSAVAPGLLLLRTAADGTPHATLYTIGTGTPVLSVTGAADPGDLTFAPDGEHAMGSRVGVLKLSTLTYGRSYMTFYPEGTLDHDTPVAFAPDGTAAFAQDNALVTQYPAALQDDLREYALPDMATTALTWAPDESTVFRLYDDDGPRLQALTGPEMSQSMLLAPVGGLPAPAVGEEFTMPLTLCGFGAFGDHETVHVTRQEFGGTATTLPDVTVTGGTPGGGTVSSSTYGCVTVTLDDRIPAAGSWTYQLTYDGDAVHLSGSGGVTLHAALSSPALTLMAPKTAARGATVHLTGMLGNLPYAAGTVVHVTKSDLAHTGYALPDAVVGANGTFSVTDTVPTGGPTTYTATFAGDASHTSGTASATVQVARTATPLTIKTDHTTYTNGSTSTVTAHLGTTYNDRTVSIYAHPYGGPTTLLRTGTVDSHGNLTLHYKLPHSTTFSASFPGDYRYAPATTSTNAPVYVSLTEALRGYYGSTTINGHTYRLYHAGSNMSLAVAVSPAKPGEFVTYEIQEWQTGAWATVAGGPAVKLSASSTATLTEPGRGWDFQGLSLRMRAEYQRDIDITNLDTAGAWQYIKLS